MSAVPSPQPSEHSAIARRAGVVAAGTLASRVLGAVRDVAIASAFRVADTDAFFVAFTIPNTLRRVLGEGAVTAAVVPVFAEVNAAEGQPGARRYVAGISGMMLTLLCLVSLLGVLTATGWTTLYAGGYQSDPAKFATAVTLTRLCFPYILFAGLAALAMGILNSVGRFGVAAFAPAWLNIAMILSPWVFAPLAQLAGLPSIAGLALAALAGGFVQVVVHLPALRREGLLPLPTFTLADAGVRKTLGLMAPLVLGSGIYQINLVLSRLFASFLPAGAQSFLYYGQRLVEIPQSMFALAVASATLPSLARQKSSGDHAAAKATLRYSLRLSLFVALPSSVALVLLAQPTISVLFGRGEFTDFHVQQTARSLSWMAASTWAVAAIHPITRMYYAYGDTRTPVFCSALNLLCFCTVSLVWMPRFGHVAIAMATSAGALAQLLGLCAMLRRRIGPLQASEVFGSAARALIASAVMGLVIYDIARLGDFTRAGSGLRDLVVYVFAVGFGAIVYGAACMLLRAQEIHELLLALRRKRARP